MKFNSERGSAVIDFVLYGVVLQVGLLMFGLQVFSTQANQLAAESIARHSLRSFVLAGIAPRLTANQVLNDFGVDKKATVQFLCNPDCESEGALLAVKVVVGSSTATAKFLR